MPISDYFGLIPIIFLILTIIEIWRFFSVSGRGEFGAGLRTPKWPSWGKKEKKIEEKVEKGREKQAEFSERLSDEDKKLKEKLEEEELLEDKEKKIDAAEEEQEKEVGKGIQELNKYIDVSRQLPPSDPRIPQYEAYIEELKKELNQRLDYIKQLEGLKEQVEKQEEEIIKREGEEIGKERRITRRKKRYEKKDFQKVNNLIKTTPPGPERDKLIEQRNQILKDVWGDATLKSVLRHEKKIDNEKKKLVKEEEKASEKRIETIEKIQELFNKPMRKLTEAETKKIKVYFEEMSELGKKEDNIRLQIEAIEKKMGALRTQQERVDLKFLQEEVKEVQKAKQMAGEK